MDVILTNFYGDFGGGEFALLGHVRWLLAKGVAVHVLLVKDGPVAELLRKEGAGVGILGCRLDCGPRGAYLTAGRLLPGLIRRIRRIRPDYIVCYTPQEMPFVAIAARLCRVPVVYRDQSAPGASVNGSDWREGWLPWLHRHALDGIVATTRARCDDLAARGLRADRVAHVYLGVDPRNNRVSPEAAGAVKGEAGIPRDAFVLGLFGRLIDLKGHETFLESIAGLGRRDVHCLVVGGTQLNDEAGPAYLELLKKKAAALGIADRVHFTGFRKDVPALMSACDVVCHASWWEPFGLVLVEAMLCGKPVVASDVSGPREIVVHGETGYLYPVKDSGAMTDCIRRLLSDSGLRARMGDAGRRRATDLFDLEKNLRALDDVINSFVAASGVGRRRAGE